MPQDERFENLELQNFKIDWMLPFKLKFQYTIKCYGSLSSLKVIQKTHDESKKFKFILNNIYIFCIFCINLKGG